jgi:hypothetical protein
MVGSMIAESSDSEALIGTTFEDTEATGIAEAEAVAVASDS